MPSVSSEPPDFVLARKQGRFLGSAEVTDKWLGVSKTLLTACICQGDDAVVTDVPDAVIEILRVTCPELLVMASD